MADAVVALESADNGHEQRDRVIEVFRSVVRCLAALALAARVQYGSGSVEESPQAHDLLAKLRRNGLTDGEWWGLARELLATWSTVPDTHALPALVRLFHGPDRLHREVLDELLRMRKKETVAHGTTGDEPEAEALVEKRLPALDALLRATERLWESARIVVPRPRPERDEDRQRGWVLMGATLSRGRWQRVELAAGVRLPAGELAVVASDGKPLLALHPVLLARRPSPGAPEEIFFLDGDVRGRAAFVALPSMAEHRADGVWAALDARMESSTNGAASDVAADSRPFRGLESFGPQHAAVFVGRETLQEELANLIRRHSLVTVCGASGSGKTSLLRAGVEPLLQREEAAYRDAAAPRFHVVYMRPTADPIAALTRKLAELPRKEDGPAAESTSAPDEPDALVEKARAWVGTTGRRLVLVVDQFEEVFTLCPDAERRDVFAGVLVRLAAEDPTCRVVLSVRDDFLGRVASLGSLKELYLRHARPVTTPDRDALERTLVEPARRAGFAFEEGLVERMVSAVEREPAALALLQFTAERLWKKRDQAWKRLTTDAYDALGSVEGALARHADKVLEDMTAGQRVAAKALLLRLVTAERTRAVCTRVELLDAARGQGDVASALDLLVAARLVVAQESEAGGCEDGHELAHEALIQHWAQLQRWLDEDREGHRIRASLAQAAKQWDARGRPKALLWRDEVLDEERVWRRRAHPHLTVVEQAFVEASETAERRTRRLVRGTIGAVVVILAAFTLFALAQWRDARRAERAATAREAEARRERGRALLQALVAEARQRRTELQPVEAFALLRAAAASASGSREQAAVESAGVYQLAASPLALVLDGHTGKVTSVAISPDGTRVVTASDDATAGVWNARTGALLHVLAGHRGEVVSVAISPDGTRVATASNDDTARLWDTRTGVLLRALEGHTSSVRSVVFSPDRASVATASWDGTARLWDVRTGALLHALEGHSGGVQSLAFSPDGSCVATASLNGTARLWDARSGALLHALEGHVRIVTSVAFSPDGTRVATASADSTARLWDAGTGALLHALEGHSDRVDSAVFSPDGTRVATASRDRTARLWDTRTGALLRALAGHTAVVRSVAFSPGGIWVATASEDHTARLWDTRSGALLHVLRGHRGEVGSVAFSPDGTRVATASVDRTTRLWDARGRALLHALEGHTGEVASVAFSPDGTRVATASLDRSTRLWDARGGTLLHALEGHTGGVQSVAFSPDGTRVATASRDGTARLWDARTGALLHALEGHGGEMHSVAFSPDGTRVATAVTSGPARLWDARTGALLHALGDPTDPPWSVAFSPDGTRVATTSADGPAQLWDTRTGALLHALEGHMGDVVLVTFSPDGTRVATASWDTTARLWDARTGAQLHALEGHSGHVYSVAFSPDGTRVATASQDGTARLWDVRTGALLHALAGHTRGVLSIAFSPDGARIATGSADGTARLWRTEPPDLPRLVRQTAARTNLRVCPETLAVVPVVLGPHTDLVWAAPRDCVEATVRAPSTPRVQARSPRDASVGAP